MPHWLHRTTKQYLVSVPEYELPDDVSNYILYPNLSAVEGWHSKYWEINGDNVSLLNQTQRDAVDAAELEANRDLEADNLDDIENILRAFALVVLDEFNVLRNEHSLSPRTIAQMKNSLRNKLGT